MIDAVLNPDDLPGDEEIVPAPESPPETSPPSAPVGSSAGPILTVALAAASGAATGLLGVILWQAIPALHALAYGPLLEPFSPLQPYVVVLVPALGGLLVGIIAAWGVPEVRGPGVPAVMAAVAAPGLAGRLLRPIVALARPVATVLTLGTGGSAGLEGPVVLGGAALTETLTTRLKLPPAHRRTLLAGVSAGAIAAVLDAPLAGLAFALEVILGGFSAVWTGHVGTLAAVLVATVSAVAVRRAVMGSISPIVASSYPLTRPADLILVAGLGLVAGVMAAFFSWLIAVAEDVFNGWRLPAFLRPAVGGLAVGILAFLLPLEGTRSPLLGPGLETLELALRGEVVLTSLLLLIVLKSAATAFTVGSGGSGDVFGPALVVGGAVGGAWGTLAHMLLPGLGGPSGGYALVGMVAVLAGAIHAPIAAILLGWELVGDVHVLPALIIAALTARWVAGRLDPDSVYTALLERQGLRLRAGRDAAVLEALTLADVLGATGPVPAPRLDDPALAQVPIAHLDDSLAQALQLLAHDDADRLLVVDPALPGRLMGIVRLADIEDAYRRAAGPPAAA